MTLTMRVDIDHEPVAYLVARRTSGPESPLQPEPLEVNSYEVRLFDVTGGDVKQIGDAVDLQHTFGDGPRHLAHLALSATLAQR